MLGDTLYWLKTFNAGVLFFRVYNAAKLYRVGNAAKLIRVGNAVKLFSVDNAEKLFRVGNAAKLLGEEELEGGGSDDYYYMTKVYVLQITIYTKVQ